MAPTKRWTHAGLSRVRPRARWTPSPTCYRAWCRPTTADTAHPNAVTGVEHVQDADPDPVVTADTFAYDRAGRMITRTIGATTTGMIWDVSSNLVATTQTGQDRVYVYDVGGQRVAQLNVGSLASATPLSATVYLAATEVTDANTASGSTGVVSATRFIGA